ncbi:phosphoribosyltransferase family protein [Pseudomonas cannabina]|uniref:Competence protein ComF n=3 Tax=Pseudomonas syringae group TaxID=136849 RepID=A0A3M3Q4Y8_PSECA|nr:MULTISPECIES: ComF family protein [Pseudomonas syringae group]KPB74132.1 Competence protein ComF [Pseudomonas syringae pv. maculicola]KPW24254.1 Competence protein ComF [Pseudomonas cannabina pv. alisalensis]MBM0137895.1 ComF family protein [Pseudomonas cannabina pv. alisalensis]QHE95512.1 ComF family protein [Pseudomonas syringae pv. maculicola str. ES4326]QQN22473.1 ComF family protein [Pseudomonas cannabina pv. alisalensis]
MRCQPSYNHEVYIWLKNKQTCLLCDERSEVPAPVCVPCEAELPWLGDQCERCALPMPIAGLECVQCSKRSPAFAQVIAPWLYDFPVDSLITRFKHNGKWPMGRLLAELCGHFIQHRFDEGQPRPDCLLPVPLATKRLRQRGYNQAAMLAGWLGQQLQLPVDEQHVLRSRETTAQQGLDAKARKRNLRGAFTLRDPDWVHGKHLAVVDDVLTTGSTAEVIARLLNSAGARRVDVYCLARTPKPGD